FTTLTIDLERSELEIEGCYSSWEKETPNEINFFAKDTAPPETIVRPCIRERKISQVRTENPKATTTSAAAHEATPNADNLKVMTWNIWGRLNQDPRYTVQEKTARQRTIEIIQESGADIVAMIETYGSAKDIAQALDFHYYTPARDANLCIFSRYPLTDVGPLEDLSSFSFIAATATLPNGQAVRIYNIWLTSGGRHIVEIKNQELSDQDFCSGDDIRYDMLKEFLHHADFKEHVANCEQVPVIVAGDFNCVSHLDHTWATKHAGLNQGRILPTKVSKAMLQAGFLDSFREVHSDLLPETLGHTWTTVGMGYVYESGKGFVPVDENPEPQYRDPYARIDYIYSVGSKLRPVKSRVLTHHPMQDQRSFPEFPSDHAAVLTHFALPQS
ncbi:MAG: endonuclease/exonuclease/phosphatase family protein, partial [Planctomycetota bacterium]